MYGLILEKKPVLQKLLALDKGQLFFIKFSFVFFQPHVFDAGANPVTEHEFKLFQRAMSEQGLSHSSTAEIIAKASSKKNSNLDAWGYDFILAQSYRFLPVT